MAYEGIVQADPQAFTDSFAHDPANDLLPQYDVEFTQNLEDSWLSTALTRETEVLDSNLLPSHLRADDASTNVDNDASFSGLDQINIFLQSLQRDESPPDYINTGWIPSPWPTSIDDLGPVVLETNTTDQGQDAVVPTTHASTVQDLDQTRASSRVASEPAKPSRTKISKEVRAMLDEHFRNNPYPSEGELTLLSEKTGLASKVINTWFVNARSRRTMPQVDYAENSDNNADTYIQEHNILPDQTLSPLTFAPQSRDSPKEHDHMPTAASPSMLERYLTQPKTQDSVLNADIKQVLQEGDSQVVTPVDPEPESPFSLHRKPSKECLVCGYVTTSFFGMSLKCTPCHECGKSCIYNGLVYHRCGDSSTSRFPPIPTPRQSSPMRAFSSAGSEHSIGSQASFGSRGSRISIDSRGSRRGRKRWTRPPTPPVAHQRKFSRAVFLDDRTEMSKGSRDEIRASLEIVKTQQQPKSHSYFCTWPACKKSFHNRSAWARHEEAVHHCPYQWICSLDVNTVMRLPQCFGCGERDALLSHVVECHFRSCASKSEECRTFLREDQLSQHIKGAHIDKGNEKISIPKSLLSAWKRDNPSILQTALTCGFCGLAFDTWAKRQDHVFDHMRRDICKSSWWPERLPTLISQLPSTGPFACLRCKIEFPDIKVATLVHSTCITWSCRYLSDWHAIFLIEAERRPEQNVETCVANCRLCNFHLAGLNLECLVGPFLQALQQHADGHQLRTCHQDVFTNEDDLMIHLAAEHKAVSFDTAAWRSLQFLEKMNDKYVARTSFEPFRKMLCPTKNPGYHFAFSDTVS